MHALSSRTRQATPMRSPGTATHKSLCAQAEPRCSQNNKNIFLKIVLRRKEMQTQIEHSHSCFEKTQSDLEIDI